MIFKFHKGEYMQFYKFFNELMLLNPNVEFNMDNPAKVSNPYEQIYCSVDPSKLVLPNGFYYNEKNGITNKHNTASGEYISIKVNFLQNSVSSVVKNDHKNNKEKDIVDNEELIQKLAELNPSVEFKIENPYLVSNPYEEVFCSVNLSQLVLPKGFYVREGHNGEIGITNKHRTQSGTYTILGVRPLKEFSVNVNPLEQVEHPISAQDYWNDNVRQSAQENNEDYDFYSFLRKLKELNPWLKLDVSNPQLVSDAQETIYFTRPQGVEGTRKVIFPAGFSFNTETKVISNKNTCKSGNYIEIKMQNVERAKEESENIDKTFMNDNQLEKCYAQSPRLREIYGNLIPDLSQSEDNIALCYALQKLNPDMEFTVIDPTVSKKSSQGVVYVKPKAKGVLKTAIKVLFKKEVFVMPNGWKKLEGDLYVNSNGTTVLMDMLTSKVKKECYSQEELQKEFDNCPELYTYKGVNDELKV